MMLSVLLTMCMATVGHAGDQPLRLPPSEIRAEHPEIGIRVDTMQPIRNRAGAWFFPGADLTHPFAQILIKERIRARQDEASIRVALVYALEPEHRFGWHEIASEDPAVRAAMLHGYKGLDTQESGAVLRHALQDESALVRAEAARLVGYRKEVGILSSSLLVGLTDPSEDVRRLAVRSLGWLEVKEAFLPVSGLLDDASPDVRVAVVRALAKIDIQRARALPAINALQVDQHARVQRAVKRVLQP